MISVTCETKPLACAAEPRVLPVAQVDPGQRPARPRAELLGERGGLREARRARPQAQRTQHQRHDREQARVH